MSYQRLKSSILNNKLDPILNIKYMTADVVQVIVVTASKFILNLPYITQYILAKKFKISGSGPVHIDLIACDEFLKILKKIN